MTPILVDPHAVRWGPASTSWLLPLAMLAPADADAALSLTASVRQLRWAFTVALLLESKTRPRAEAKWHRDFGSALSERDWIDAWLSVHKAPTSGKVRSFLWKLMHRRLPLLWLGWVFLYPRVPSRGYSEPPPRMHCVKQ